jgi:hypothetical protein
VIAAASPRRCYRAGPCDGARRRSCFRTAACAGPAASGGASSGNLFPGDDEHEAQARSVVEQRAKFDLECDAAELTRISDVTRLGQQMTSMSFGARGCEKKATYYVECVSNWGKITCNAQVNSQSE